MILPLLSGPEVPEKLTVPPALVMKRALPPLLLLVNCVSAPLLVVMMALPAVLASVKDSKKPLLVVMLEFPAELALANVIAPLLVKLGADAELLTMPAPLISKSARLTVKEYIGAPEVNRIVPIEVELEMVTDVAAPLFVNVAMLSGGFGLELQFVPSVHSFGFGGGAVQVPSTACAAFGANMASAPSHTLPSSAARLRADGADAVTIRIALSRCAARGAAGAAARVACERHPYERIPRTPTGGSRRASP